MTMTIRSMEDNLHNPSPWDMPWPKTTALAPVLSQLGLSTSYGIIMCYVHWINHYSATSASGQDEPSTAL